MTVSVGGVPCAALFPCTTLHKMSMRICHNKLCHTGLAAGTVVFPLGADPAQVGQNGRHPAQMPDAAESHHNNLLFSSHQALHMQQDPVQQNVQQPAQAPFSQSGEAGRAKKQTVVADQGHVTKLGPAFNTRSRTQQSLGEGEAAGDGRSRQISQHRSRKRAAKLMSTDVALPAVPDHEQACKQQGRPTAKRVRYISVRAEATHEDIGAAHMENDDDVRCEDATQGDSQDVRRLSCPAAKGRRR